MISSRARQPENTLARQMFAQSMKHVGGRAIFCRHAEFLGALGSLSDCLQRHRAMSDELESINMY